MWRCNNAFLCRNEHPSFGKGVTLCQLVAVFCAELLGTGVLLHIGCMGVLAGYDEAAVSLAFGLAAATVIQCIGAVSGGHVNPAVSVAALIMGKVTTLMCIVHVVAQFLGAFLGYTLLILVTPEEIRLERTCCTLPAVHVSVLQALSCEFVATSILIFLFCSCCDRRNDHKQDTIPIKFGLAITVLLSVVGPYTGASINTARSFAPAMVHDTWSYHWIYWIAPFMASVLVPIFYRVLLEDSDYRRAKRRVPHEEMPDLTVSPVQIHADP